MAGGNPQNQNPIGLIVGLGNPGKEYAETRHNLGFMVVEKLLATFPGDWEKVHAFDSFYYTGRVRGRKLVLQMPQTYMNLSGKAVAPLLRKLELAPEQLLVIHDDMDFPLGRLRLRQGGSAGGHHGIESVITEIGSGGFARLRVGIGHSERGSSGTVDHVLEGFSGAELPIAEKILEYAVQSVQCLLYRGIAKAMNEFNAVDVVRELEEAAAPQD